MSHLSFELEKFSRVCRYCKGGGELISPCLCEGQSKYVHLACLKKRLIMKSRLSCEICYFPFEVSQHNRSLLKWSFKEIPKSEIHRLRRKICYTISVLAIVGLTIGIVFAPKKSITIEVPNSNLTLGNDPINDGSKYFIKLATLSLLVTAGVTFLFAQISWYKSFFTTVAHANRDISIELEKTNENRRKSYLSIIHEEDEARSQRGSFRNPTSGLVTTMTTKTTTTTVTTTEIGEKLAQ